MESIFLIPFLNFLFDAHLYLLSIIGYLLRTDLLKQDAQTSKIDIFVLFKILQ